MLHFPVCAIYFESMERSRTVQPRYSRPLTETVAAKLAHDLESLPGPRLPSLRDLAARYCVCVPVMSEVLHLLASQGLVEVRPKRRAVVVGRAPVAQPRKLPAPDQLYAEVKEQITSGDVAAGSPLPKVAFYVAKKHVANRTVLGVYRRLVDDGVVYRRGKAFIVGRPDNRAPRISVLYRPVLAIMTHRNDAWTSLCRGGRTMQFGQTFLREAEVHHVRLVEAQTSGVQSGRESVGSFMRRIAELGENYCGTLIEGNRSEIDDIEAWVTRLLKYRKPVVWFDKNDEGLMSPVRSKLFTRCHYSEHNGARAAVEYLVDCGHKQAAFIMTERSVWQQTRRAALEQTARAHAPPLHLESCVTLSGQEWLDPARSRVEAELDWLARHADRAVRSAIRFFVDKRDMLLRSCKRHHTHAWNSSRYAGIAAVTRMRQAGETGDDTNLRRMTGLVWAGLALVPALHAGATAIIAPSDQLARSFHLHWLEDLGLATPRDISVISFDNTYRDAFFPLTTVDFGFGFLGYHAFHALYGDVPVARDRNGNIAARARVIDNGSVAVLATRD